jgi:hypothetical protein
MFAWQVFGKKKIVLNLLTPNIKITLVEYHVLHTKGASHAIPMMCVLTIKKDEMMNPLREKSCIVVLGNHKDRVWTKPKKYTPVLCLDRMHLMVS